MGATKKHAKGRLDKYYHMAKEQGYRARSAFKLIQLNKKYNFLEKAKVTVDLCAAPGGWCQVAQKYMPNPSLVIGLDLEKIKTIPGVITHVEDITSSKCRATLKKELKTWKADVFLHDGAPNVGTSWAQDAFSQSELVLSALKLATEFLMPNGTFVTKVFRSKDYNKLIWVMNQLFAKVEATKPSASRTVSAEIFVVCQGYYAPKKIDPRLLDPKFAFKEVDDEETVKELDPKMIKERQGAIMNDLFHPEKRRRHREGYQEGDYTLFTTNDVSDFITSIDFLSILSKSSELVFAKDEFSQRIKSHPLTTEEISQCLSDLKVLGKKEFKAVIRWRDLIRIATGIVTKEIAEPVEEVVVEKTIEEQIQDERERTDLLAKKEKKKRRERKAKSLMRLQLGMDTPDDIGIEGAQNYNLPDIDMGTEELERPPKKQKQSNVDDSDDDIQYIGSEASSAGSEYDNDEDFEYDSEDEAALKVQRLDEEMDSMYTHYRSRLVEKNPSLQIRKSKEGTKAAFEEWYGIDADSKDPVISENRALESSDDSDSDDSDEQDQVDKIDEPQEVLSSQAKMFFDNPLFKHRVSTKGALFDEEMTLEDSEEVPKVAKVISKKRKADKMAAFANDEKIINDDFRIVPIGSSKKLDEDESDDDENNLIDSAEAYTIAQQVIRKSGKRDLIDGAFNRYTFNDPEGLPEWFMQDEGRHNKPMMPVTKEAIDIIRQQMKAMDARPIRKVAEAKFRKQMRTQRRLEKAKNKGEGLNNDEDIPERAKMEAIQKLMAKAKNPKPTKKEKPTLVVARGVNKANKGRPKGVKGRYKMVDPRMKKELRADKRITKAKKGSNRK